MYMIQARQALICQHCLAHGQLNEEYYYDRSHGHASHANVIPNAHKHTFHVNHKSENRSRDLARKDARHETVKYSRLWSSPFSIHLHWPRYSKSHPGDVQLGSTKIENRAIANRLSSKPIGKQTTDSGLLLGKIL